MRTSEEFWAAAKRDMTCMALDLPHQDEVTHTVSVFDEQFIVLMEEQVA
jgi:hypothetical protein